ncbi:glutamate--tRNA ligase [Sphingobacterium sp. JB170]|uniref:glutamate--tRNA ligase n=1 Tax=Sphingobacterium sp. JB170 TaxID=1434842 RepID=UPI000B350D45|nr:glutamate--tRNA ligase [Sphingobacterium sp. JB170]
MSSQREVRVRFAPSPTGGLHLGGVRTALFNYLFAKQHGGDFILRVEDTDQTRFVPGAEEYINDCLDWCGILPDESPSKPAAFGPYRQSERKASYRRFAEELIESGYAYYAFDTAEELEEQRKVHPNFRYSHENRLNLRNSLSFNTEQTNSLLAAGTPHTIRIKIPTEQTVYFEDMIRGAVTFDTNLIDDKVLLKADGMPTYHLAVVVDDKAMEISHVFRGEEWLPSAPVHILLWEYLGWKEQMPNWAHLPLILKPDGKGKLSKRDGDRLGFPVYAMNWTDPKTGDLTKGFRETGFLPEAFVNMLATLGWNDGTEKELFTMAELIAAFSVERISKAGAKYDFEKAKWYNHEWMKATPNAELLPQVEAIFKQHELELPSQPYLNDILSLVKERMTFVEDFWQQASFFFVQPEELDLNAIKGKWNADKTAFFEELTAEFESLSQWNAEDLGAFFKEKVASSGMKIGELMMPFRIMLVGGKFGPDVFKIAELLGKKGVIDRVAYALGLLQ